MCKYCDFKDVIDEDTSRGELIIDDCDVDTYLEKECFEGLTTYYLVSNSYYAGEPCEEVNYCPKCGRKLTENDTAIDEGLKNLSLRISHKDGELTPNDILSLIETLLQIGADKNIILKCDNVAELKAIGIYYNVLNNK